MSDPKELRVFSLLFEAGERKQETRLDERCGHCAVGGGQSAVEQIESGPVPYLQERISSFRTRNRLCDQ